MKIRKGIIVLTTLMLILFAVTLTGCGTKSVTEMKAEKDIHGLIKALSNGDSETRMEAAEALGEIGDRNTTDDLVNTLRDRNQSVREEAAKALDNLGWIPANDTENAYYLIAKGQWDEAAELGDPAVKACLQFIQYDDVKDKALDCIAQIGEAAIPSLISSLKYYATQDSAAVALEKIGEPVKEPLLKSLKEDKDWQSRTAALAVLDKLNWEARSLPTGTELISGSRSGEGELTVENGLTWDALIILSKEEEPSKVIRSVYIQANDSCTITSIPDGRFILYDSLGKDWDSEAAKFTIAEEYSRFEEILSYETNLKKGSYTTYEVTLYPVAGGTAETQDVNETDFPKLS